MYFCPHKVFPSPPHQTPKQSLRELEGDVFVEYNEWVTLPNDKETKGMSSLKPFFTKTSINDNMFSRVFVDGRAGPWGVQTAQWS